MFIRPVHRASRNRAFPTGVPLLCPSGATSLSTVQRAPRGARLERAPPRACIERSCPPPRSRAVEAGRMGAGRAGGLGPPLAWAAARGYAGRTHGLRAARSRMPRDSHGGLRHGDRAQSCASAGSAQSRRGRAGCYHWQCRHVKTLLKSIYSSASGASTKRDDKTWYI